MTRTRWLGLIGGFVVFCTMLLLPAPAGMDLTAWHVAALTVLMAIWWMTEALPLTVTALLPFLTAASGTPPSSYRGIDVSSRMVDLAQRARADGDAVRAEPDDVAVAVEPGDDARPFERARRRRRGKTRRAARLSPTTR